MVQVTRRGLLGWLAGAIPASIVAIKGVQTVSALEPVKAPTKVVPAPRSVVGPTKASPASYSADYQKPPVLYKSRYKRLRVQLHAGGLPAAYPKAVQFNNGIFYNNAADPQVRRWIDVQLQKPRRNHEETGGFKDLAWFWGPQDFIAEAQLGEEPKQVMNTSRLPQAWTDGDTLAVGPQNIREVLSGSRLSRRS